MNQITGNVNIDGELFERVAVTPSERFDGWVCVRIPHRDAEAVYHIPPQHILWVLEGSEHGPLR
jgi:hypothetical protein